MVCLAVVLLINLSISLCSIC
uniref:GM09101p n=1 Tax=Drosophila melanogaster TaxID=7227 RepID=Q8T3M3_DROME|nr:GM09101p [Drosophila melanogaster]